MSLDDRPNDQILPLFRISVIMWHFAAVSYSLYKKIDAENRRPMTATIHHRRTTAETTAAAAATEAPPPRPSAEQPTVHQIVITPPSPPPSYDRIYNKV